MKRLSFLITIALEILVWGCSQKATEEKLSSQTDSTLQSSEEKASLDLENELFKYNGTEENELSKALENFVPLTSIRSLAEKCIWVKDSLERLRQSESLTDPTDSLIFMPYQSAAYEAILEYQKLMLAGPKITTNVPSLLQLKRVLDPSDPANTILPAASESKFLAQGKFFFLGGFPYISTVRDESNTIFTDPKGNPESRYQIITTENSNYILNSIYQHKATPTNITFGPPLNSYDSGPQEVNGIGSLIHNFVTRIPAFFLTENGIIPADLISISVKIVPEALGCVSDKPKIEFSCSQNINEKNILGVYIPLNSENLTSCAVTRQGNTVWTADLNGDGIADIASVSSTFIGMTDDKMFEELWFVNIGGKWQIIDWAQDMDCT
jgi:hypothetical protein